MASPIYRLASHFLRKEWLQLFPVTAALQRRDLWERHRTSHHHQLVSPFRDMLSLLPLQPWCLMTNIQLRSISSCNSTKYSQLCCFHTWICCLENHRPIERHLTTTGVIGSKTLYCISAVLGNTKAHIHWRIRFLLHSCLTEIILNKPSKTDSDSSTAGIAQENFVSVRGKILPRLILLQTASSWFILILEVQALFVASTWMAASHNLLGFFAYSFVWSVGCCFSDAFDPIWHSPLGVWCGNSRAALTPQEQKEPQFRSEPSEKEKKKK